MTLAAPVSSVCTVKAESSSRGWVSPVISRVKSQRRLPQLGPRLFSCTQQKRHMVIWGMLTSKDVVLALSNSGTSAEIILLLPLMQRLDAIDQPDQRCKLNTCSCIRCTSMVSVSEEACPLNLAPTSSTTAALVMGDALAIALLEKKGFSHEDFAFSHPGGALGRKLLLKVDDIMHAGEAFPVGSEAATVSEALLEMTAKRLGFTTVLSDDGYLIGFFQTVT